MSGYLHKIAKKSDSKL